MRTNETKAMGGILAFLALGFAGGCGSVADDGASAEDRAGEAAEKKTEDVGKSSEALSNGQQGFAWVFNGSVGYPWAYATSNLTITSSNTGTGTYVVNFPGIGGAGGNVQVVAYGSGSERCKVSSWGSTGTTENVYVSCTTAAGAPVNTNFVVHFVRPPGTGPGAFLWADQPSTASYNPSASYSWNSTGGVNRITRSSAGVYTAYLPGLAVSGGTFQVTAYGSSADHCKIQSWGPSGTDQSVTVRCFNAAGAAVDTYFSLNFQGNAQVAVHDYGAYAWADQPTTASYTPSTGYSYNSGSINGWSGCVGWIGTNSAGRTSTGSYFMQHTFLDPQNSGVHITSYGTDSSYCKVTGWSSWTSGTQVNVACFNSAGSPVDTRYVETYSTKWYRGPC
jgi:hypothetical protein